MKTLCIVGNSHVASLKQGWDAIRRRYPDVEITFFGSPANSLSAVEARGATIVPANKNLEKAFEFTSGGKREIATGEYSAFLCYGMGLQLPVVDLRLSSAVRQALLKDSIQSTLSMKVATLLRAVSGNPVHVGHNPQFATPRKPKVTRTHPYAQVFDSLADVMRPDGLTLVPQPAATLDTDGWSTRPEFGIGSKRLVIGEEERLHPESERAHMNGVFGELYLTELLSRISWR